MYLVQTVSTRPRPWSSYTNINNSKEVRSPVRMNSAEEISKYHDHNSHYCSPVLARRTAGTSYDFPEKLPKKDKKWSFGSLFRRKKKPGSESSSEDENDNKNFLQKRKKRTDKRKRTNKAIGFDHVVIPPSSHRHTALTNGYKNHDDSATKNFIPASDFTTKFVPLKDSQESFNRSNNSLNSPSVNSLGRRRKEILKARAEARRDTSKGEESSDEDSQRSAFKSDDSLSKHRDGSLSRKSRAARTQRYLQRRSKDDEAPDQLRMCKSDIEYDRFRNIKSQSRSPILSSAAKSKLSYANSAPSSRPNFSGLSTIPPSHSNHGKYRTANLTNGAPYKQSSSFHAYNDPSNNYTSTNVNPQRSLSCGANIHNTAPSPENESDVVHVQFQLGKPFNKYSNVVLTEKKQPPPPPPRDPRRILNIQSYDGRPISYSFESGYHSKNNSDQSINKTHLIPEINKNINLNPNCRSTSEDHISWEPSQRIPLIPRPSSATPEANQLQNLNGKKDISNGYRYLADKNPRSRKPICIQSYNREDNLDQQNKPQRPFDFWKKKDEEVTRSNPKISTTNSPIMFTAQTQVRTNIFLPNGTTTEIKPPDNINRESSPFRPITPTQSQSPSNTDKTEPNDNSVDETDRVQRKSSNLEDALDELEAIYNSLHLGDEDLLERAEQREVEAAQKRRDALFESFPNTVSRGALSDSGFGYDLNFETSRKKRYLKRGEPDRKMDDMAFRKLNKDRYNTISDPQSVVSRVSYLLTSPVFSKTVDEDTTLQKPKNKGKEPDVTFDDVVYRNVKHTNNTLKVTENQPPFGIPIGPVLSASNSDYLHAMPETTHRYTFKSKKIPDVVKDDLAFRNLRKDPNKEPALPQTNLSIEDYINNNSKSGESTKKKRAVRSLSANIFNLMQKEWKQNSRSMEDNNSNAKEQKIGDVADALEIARQILREKDDKINATRKAFMSDGELKYRKSEKNSFSEQRLNFLNQMKSSNSFDNEPVYHHRLQVNIPVSDFERLDAKPPTPDRSRRSSRPSTKESTPVPTSSSEEAQIKKQLQQSTIDQLLTSLAVEAREASERITNELKVYDEEKQFKKALEQVLPLKDKSTDRPKERVGLVSEKLKELEENTISASLNLQLPKVDSAEDHAKLCEKLLECVVDDTEFLATTKVESEPSEEVAKIKIEPLLSETIANVVLTPDDSSKLEVNPVSTEVFSESEHDYVNIQSTDETEKDLETETRDSTEATSHNFCSEIQIDGITEVSNSTEVDDEERELLRIDDDAVSVDICVSPLEKHKAEILAAFDELRLSEAENISNNGNVSKNIKSIEQTNKDGGST
ncbi:hypothetical protein ILUMI_05606 [Ignelater luminosus]|uniref:Uncharacterized protein n=1 Tax=Ignelater luminosus TaxID=2038154 RepID=A0A8K0GJY5_IGNLU|nr:hypothetical protein ILUMI_05606 [Ignelater luminosus]